MTTSAPHAGQRRRLLVALLLLALALRVAYVLSLDAAEPYTSKGGDSGFYLAHGYALVTVQPSPVMPVDLSHLGVAPVYLLFNGLWQALLPSDAGISGARLAAGLPAAYGLLYATPSPAAVVATRLAQALFSAATCYLAYRLARRISGSERAGLVTAGVLAVSPAFILEAGVIGTETLYIFLLASALAIYVSALDRTRQAGGWLALAGAGLLLGLATLTRAVLLLFPLGLALHLLLVYRPWAALKRAGWLLLVYSLVVSTWTIYNYVRYDGRLIIAGEGFAAFLYVGAAGWGGAQGTDAQLAADAAEAGLDIENSDRQQVYTGAAGSAISSDPAGYLRRRVTELAGAYLQPHGTVFFSSSDSLRAMMGHWLRKDRSVGGLLALTREEAFWPKLAVYVFHYAGLAAGLAGMWLTRRRWRVTLPLIGFIMYTTLVHLVLLALPRYIFPTELFWWVFAGAALARLGGIRQPPLEMRGGS